MSDQDDMCQAAMPEAVQKRLESMEARRSRLLSDVGQRQLARKRQQAKASRKARRENRR